MFDFITLHGFTMTELECNDCIYDDKIPPEEVIVNPYSIVFMLERPGCYEYDWAKTEVVLNIPSELDAESTKVERERLIVSETFAEIKRMLPCQSK